MELEMAFFPVLLTKRDCVSCFVAVVGDFFFFFNKGKLLAH